MGGSSQEQLDNFTDCWCFFGVCSSVAALSTGPGEVMSELAMALKYGQHKVGFRTQKIATWELLWK
eukprot:2438404-Amphidinium_carterae.1